MDECVLCGEPAVPGDDCRPMGTIGADRVPRMGWAHRECLLREVAGGIGHHLDHDYWCVRMKDPDGGLSYRESALAVDQLMSDHE